MKPEDRARQKIDQLLESAGWKIQDFKDLNLSASSGIAIGEFPLKSGFADAILYGDVKSLEETMRKRGVHFCLRRIKEALVSFADPGTGKTKVLFTRRNVKTVISKSGALAGRGCPPTLEG